MQRSKTPPRRYSNAPPYIVAKPTALNIHTRPSGFHWLIEGVLGGTARPGLTRSIEEDAAALRGLNTKVLISLTENWAPPVAELASYGIKSHHVKIPDMCAPNPAVAFKLCQYVDTHLKNRSACIFHCQAGRGRTGTMLAAQLVYYGRSGDEAITEVRLKNPLWIESQAQLDFIQTFETFLAEAKT